MPKCHSTKCSGWSACVLYSVLNKQPVKTSEPWTFRILSAATRKHHLSRKFPRPQININNYRVKYQSYLSSRLPEIQLGSHSLTCKSMFRLGSHPPLALLDAILTYFLDIFLSFVFRPSLTSAPLLLTYESGPLGPPSH